MLRTAAQDRTGSPATEGGSGQKGATSATQDRSTSGSEGKSGQESSQSAGDSKPGASQASGRNDQPKRSSGSAPQEQTGATANSQQNRQSQDSGSASTRSQSTSQQSGSTTTSTSSQSTATTSSAVANLSTEQRTQVTQAFTSTTVNTVSEVNFNVSVGATISDQVRLAPVPEEVVRIVPQYRGYRYVVVRDQIVIVEPRTKKIVEVIHKSGGSRTSASLKLSSDQRKRIRTTVETTGSTRSPSARLELRQGLTLPQEVTLRELPPTIITEVPELRTYRIVVIEDEIAIVEPESRRVIEIIQE